jgi:hypothetical protein
MINFMGEKPTFCRQWKTADKAARQKPIQRDLPIPEIARIEYPR